MNTTTTPSPDPPPEDIAAGLAALQEFVNDNAPAGELVPVADAEVAHVAEAETESEPEWEPDVDIEFDTDEGYTSRVRKLRAEVAEAHRLLELQGDGAPLLVDSPRVRRRRRAAFEAARLHELEQDPVALAYRDQKVRRTVSVMVMSAAGIGLAVSSIGVQASVAKALKLEHGGVGWWAAFGVEPALSLPLLAAVAAQAYSAIRGQVVDRKSAAGKKLFRTEAILLAVTLILNCWPAFVWDRFDLLPLLVHSLGPLAAVTAVWVLPTLWQVLAVLPAGRATVAPTGLTYRANTNSGGADVEALTERARTLIGEGRLPSRPSASKIQKALRCGMDAARTVRDTLAGGA
ncbi:hypothetical protein [Nonomuraea sp. NPDC049646]|uniref:hypothetical protein n=1 Tax=unclassified Nonomuraea TaxID=2593643 RepID=UPI00379D70E9